MFGKHSFVGYNKLVISEPNDPRPFEMSFLELVSYKSFFSCECLFVARDVGKDIEILLSLALLHPNVELCDKRYNVHVWELGLYFSERKAEFVH